ncbi:hypothetical protein JCM30237_16460 [Halolamina litorea]
MTPQTGKFRALSVASGSDPGVSPPYTHRRETTPFRFTSNRRAIPEFVVHSKRRGWGVTAGRWITSERLSTLRNGVMAQRRRLRRMWQYPAAVSDGEWPGYRRRRSDGTGRQGQAFGTPIHLVRLHQLDDAARLPATYRVS